MTAFNTFEEKINRRTSEQIAELIKLIQSAMPLSTESTVHLSKLIKLRYDLENIELNIIPMYESGLAVNATSLRGKDFTVKLHEFSETTKIIGEMSMRFSECWKSASRENITQLEMQFLEQHFISKYGGITGSYSIENSGGDNPLDNRLIEVLTSNGVIEIGLYENRTVLSLTNEGRKLLSGKFGRFSRAIRHAVSGAYARVVVFFSGIVSGVFCSQLEGLIIPIIKSFF